MERWIGMVWLACATAALAAPAGCPTGVAGRVVEPAPAEGARPPVGIEGYTITLDSEKNSLQAITGSDGRFLFPKVPAGAYRVKAEKRGYALVSAPAQPVAVAAGGCVEIQLVAEPDRRIYGRLYQADGKPGSGIRVVLLAVNLLGAVDSPNMFAISDAKGRYELKHVPPGVYYLGVNLDRPETPTVPFARVFYPGTRDKEMARTIEIGEHESVVEADLPLPPAETEVTMSGVVLYPDGKPAKGATLHLEDPRFLWMINTVQAITDAFGRFTIRYYDGGEYRLHAVGPCTLLTECRSAQPAEIAPGVAPNPTLMLDQPGHSVMEAYRRAAEAASTRLAARPQ
ncbi:MAG TPA: carboxypeptidase-like regulatory domain-containing protein [Bryobacteraceae bacterium]|nr:carboxypeptidase-like regulatory domain-containing protein [Bryobacteraceae bacterium]